MSREEYYRRGWWRNRLFSDDLADQAEQRPDQPAFVGHRADTDQCDVLSYRQFGLMVRRVAATLLRLGVQPGQVVSYQLPNWWQAPVLALACLKVGVIPNPISPIFRRREVGHILRHLEPRLLVLPDDFRHFSYGSMAQELVDASLIDASQICVLGSRIPKGMRSFEEVFLEEDGERTISDAQWRQRRPHPDHVAAIQFTSGTTGEPKGVMHTHNTLFAAASTMASTYRLNADDVPLVPSTMAHSTGFVHAILMPVIYGMKSVVQDTWRATTMLRLVEAEKVTWSMGATTFVADAAAVAQKAPFDLSSLRTFVASGAPIPPSLFELARHTLDVELHAVWGMTEIGAVTLTRPEDGLERRMSSDGRPWSGMQIRIVDRDGSIVPTGTAGELHARGASRFVGYFDPGGSPREPFDADGWFATGDLAVADEAGYIRITGRSKDLVIRGGENVPITEIEGLLFAHPSIRDIILVGYPDERLGERVCAVLVPETGDRPSLSQLTDFLAEQGVAKQFWPERLEIVEDLPRTPSGKVQRHLVRQQVVQTSR